MKNFGFKRLISLLLVVLMAFTMMPLQVLALESDDEVVSKDEGTMGAVDSMPFEETVLLKQYKADISKILCKYLGTSLMSEEDVKAAVAKMDMDTQDEAFMEIYDFSIAAEEELTDAELYFLDQYEGAVVLGFLAETLYDVLDYDEIALYASKTVTVLDGKTYAVDSQNCRYRLKQRLYELEQQLPPAFIRINKSALANKDALDRFAVTVTGSVDAVFKCGYREYVSRRCFAQIKRRLESR